MNQLTKVFSCNDVRMIEENRTLIFLRNDVLKTLGYKESNKAITSHFKDEGMHAAYSSPNQRSLAARQ